MVTVYFKDGHEARLQEATNAETVRDEALDTSGLAVPMLVCADDAGNRVGYFKWAEVAGYAMSAPPAQPLPPQSPPESFAPPAIAQEG